MKSANRKWARRLIALTVSAFAASTAFGENWNNPAGGGYGTLTNWTPNGIPVNPIFDLNSAGYTVTLPSAESAQTLTVQTDNPTLDLSTQTMNLSDVNVSTLAGQNGSLTVLGPGSIIANTNSASVSVGGGSSTGQLIVNAATINFQGSNGTNLSEASGSTITVDNGGKLENSLAASLHGSVVLNDGTLSDEGDMSALGGAMLSNNSTLGAFGNMTFSGNITVDDSTISSSAGVSMGFTGSLTISNAGSVSTTGVITLPATTTVDSGFIQSIDNTKFSNSGTLTIQLSASTNDPLHGASMGLYGGTLDFILQNAFTPTVGEHFDVFSYLGGNSGLFTGVNLPALPGGESWDTSQLYTAGVISVVPEPASMTLLVSTAAAVLLRRRRRA
jgi:hypothetical protein